MWLFLPVKAVVGVTPGLLGVGCAAAMLSCTVEVALRWGDLRALFPNMFIVGFVLDIGVVQ